MHVLITGGANGIGKATVEKLIQEDHEVTVYDNDTEALNRLPEEVKTFEGDVYEEDRVKGCVERTDFDVLVNCAGYYELAATEDMSAETVEKHFEANVFGALNFMRAAIPQLREKDGRIVNIASVAGRITMPYFGTYCATKHALEAVSDATRRENADNNLDIVIVEPGPISTGFNERARKAVSKYIPESFHSDKYQDILDSDRMGGVEPEKAADVVVKAIEDPNPRMRYTVTWQAWLGPKLKRFLPQKLTEVIVRKMSY